MNLSSRSDSASLSFYRLDYDHIEEILGIEYKVQLEPWTVHMFEEEVDHPHGFSWVVCLRGRVVGYLCGRAFENFLEVLNIAVHPDFQGRGVGRKILSFVLDKAVREKGANRAILEVRESNQAALGLYVKCGFRVVGERRGYYLTPSGREKALLMERELIAIGDLGD